MNITKHLLPALALLSTLCLFALTAHAQNHAQNNDLAFFTALQDIPLKPGLVELSDQTLVFDKPQGRIVESIAKIENGTDNDIRLYYKQSLPQLGWEYKDTGLYSRKQEHLHLSFENHEGQRFLRVMLEPR